MNHIQKSLLASAARKIIPFQMMKTNYGFSSADANDLEGVAAVSTTPDGTQLEVLGLQIQNLPLDASFVAIALRVPGAEEKTQELQVAFLATAPQGEDTIRLPLQPGQKYYVYVLSNKYEDGYISTDNKLVETFTSSDDPTRKIFQTGGPTDELIVENLILVESSPESEWYPYAGKYNNPNLLWADPTPLFTVAEGLAPQSSYSYLAYQRNWLDSISQDFQDAFDLQGPLGTDVMQSTFRVRRRSSGSFTTRVVWTVTNFFLNQALRATKARTYATQTWDTWSDDNRILASEDGTQVLTNYSKTKGYDPNQTNLIGILPTDSSTSPTGTDPIPEYQMTWAVHNQLAGLAVIMEYVVSPYNGTSSRSFGNRFSDGNGRSSFSSVRANEYEALAHAVKTKIDLVTADGTAESTSPVLFEDGNAIYDRISQLVSQGTSEAEGREIVRVVDEFVQKYTSARGLGGANAQGQYENYWLNPFDGATDNVSVANWSSRVLALGKSIYAESYDKFIIPKLQETDRNIVELGDLTFFPPPDSDNNEPQLAHEATLQNIRFLRGLLEETRDDLWAQGSSLNSFIVNTLVQLRDEVVGNLSRTNSITNITSANQVSNNELEVLIKDLTEPDAPWSSFQGNIIDIGNGIKGLDVSHIKTSGQYVIAIRPKGIEINIPRLDPNGADIINTPDLDKYQSKNYFYGWNIEFRRAGQDDLAALGEQRMIVGSKFQVNNHMLLISPTIDSRPDFQENIKAYIWPNSFIPVMIDLELTDHNYETLAYANYAKREFNTNTGVLQLYDFAGNPFMSWTIGERVVEDNGYAQIEFRDPIDE